MNSSLSHLSFTCQLSCLSKCVFSASVCLVNSGFSVHLVFLVIIILSKFSFLNQLGFVCQLSFLSQFKLLSKFSFHSKFQLLSKFRLFNYSDYLFSKYKFFSQLSLLNHSEYLVNSVSLLNSVFSLDLVYLKFTLIQLFPGNEWPEGPLDATNFIQGGSYLSAALINGFAPISFC